MAYVIDRIRSFQLLFENETCTLTLFHILSQLGAATGTRSFNSIKAKNVPLEDGGLRKVEWKPSVTRIRDPIPTVGTGSEPC